MDAQTMLDDGAWGLPHLFSGEPELQKPPLYYWLVAFIALLRGGTVDAWAVRLPAACSAVLCLLGLVAFGRARGRAIAGVTAAVVLMSALHFTWLARIGRIDMPLTLTTGLAVGAVYLSRTYHEALGTIPLLLLAYISIAAGVLLKGPIGAVLPFAVIGSHLLIEGALPPPWRWRPWLRFIHELGLWWGLPLVLALALPWFLWVDAATHGEFFRVFILRHNIERGFGGPTLRSSVWWFYGPQFVADFLPWSLLLPTAVYLCWRRGYWRTDPEARLGMVWLLAVTLVLSCAASSAPTICFPHIRAPPCSLDLFLPMKNAAGAKPKSRAACIGLEPVRKGVWNLCNFRVPDTFSHRLLCLLPCILALTMTAVWLVRVNYGLPAEEPFRDYTKFAAEVRKRTPRPDEVLFFRTEAHPLAFHVGRPLAVLVEWKDLEARASARDRAYVVMPERTAAEAVRSLPDVHFEELLHNTELSGGRHERPLVLVRVTR